MKKYLLLTTILILLACAVPARSSSGVDASAEEYAVYSAMIANAFAGDKVTFNTQTKIKLLVIQDVTIAEFTDKVKKDDLNFKEWFPTVSEEVVQDYKAKNKEAVRLKDSFDLKLKHVLVGKQEIEKIFDRGGWWDEFYKRYPDSGGYIVLSRVGFNAAMNRAMLFFQHACDSLCGSSQYVLLEKSNDRWRVVELTKVSIN